MGEVDARFGNILGRLADASGLRFPYAVLRRPTDHEPYRRALSAVVGIHDREKEDAGLWSGLIRCRNWRYTIVGCTAVVATRDTRFFDDLTWRFVQGSWVQPELAATLVVVHGPASEAFFFKVLQSFGFQLDEHGKPPEDTPREMLCAFYALRLLNPLRTGGFEPSSARRESVPPHESGRERILEADRRAITYLVQYWLRLQPPVAN